MTTDTPRTDAEVVSINPGMSERCVQLYSGQSVTADFARQLERELAEAKAEIESLRKDAERYRWLRHGCDKKQSTATRIAQCLYGMEWDAAIDAAMANIDPPGGE